MALIGTIRKQSGLLIIIIGVALAAFVLGDFLKPRSGRDIQPLAEVLGEDISYQQFDAKYEQNLESQKRNQNKDNLSQDEIFRLKQQTWDQIIQKIVLDNEYDQLGLVVSADELFDQIQGNEPHSYILQYFKDPETQQYDPELVRNYIKQLDQMDAASRIQWDNFVEAIKEDREKTKYKNLISKGYFMPDTFLYRDFSEKKISAKIMLVGARYNTIDDSLVTVTDDDLKKYYNDYKQNYKQEASRDIDYVIFDVKPSAKDRKTIREQAFDIYEDFKTTESVHMFVNTESDNRYDSTFFKSGELPINIDSVMLNSEIGAFVDPFMENNAWHMAKLMDIQFRPDSMKATHILISFAGAMMAGEDMTRTKDEASALADSLLNVVKSSPYRIEALAKELSDDPSAAENSGDLGWFADGTMVYPFNNAVLTNNIGNVTIAESMFGFHVIKITDKFEPVKKVRVAIIDINISPSQETFQDEFTRASEFQAKANSLDAFDTLSTNLGLNKRSAPRLQKMGNRIAGLDYARGIIGWTFREGIEIGSVSDVITMESKYVVAIITAIHEEGIPAMDEIRDAMEPLVSKELKGDIMIQRMNELSDGSSDLIQIAATLNSKVDTVDNVNFQLRNISGYGNEANVLAKVFAMEPNILSKPIKGNNAAFFVIVDEVTQPGENEDYKIYKRQLLSNFTAKVNNNSFTKTLEEKAGVVDNRYLYY
ncbi:MAG: SurA N-terminal domain-containing protein [Bacteroidales bacterium]|nr:SurA N-terminal domain-containing protein [Bacteroidales bacterium]